MRGPTEAVKVFDRVADGAHDDQASVPTRMDRDKKSLHVEKVLLSYFCSGCPTSYALYSFLPKIIVKKCVEGVVFGRFADFVIGLSEAVIDHMLQTRRDNFIIQPPARWVSTLDYLESPEISARQFAPIRGCGQHF